MSGDRQAHISDEQFQYIARISHGKDSLKMLDVIFTRGLPLDRITTTDIWATDTIRGEHPKMVTFKERADEYIWRKYRIEVEHLCAMRDGEKVTYEKLFYHIPKRKAANDAGGGALLARNDPGLPGPVASVVSIRPQTSSQAPVFRATRHKSGAGARSSRSTTSDKVQIRKPWFNAGSIQGFPVSSPGKETGVSVSKCGF